MVMDTLNDEFIHSRLPPSVLADMFPVHLVLLSEDRLAEPKAPPAATSRPSEEPTETSASESILQEEKPKVESTPKILGNYHRKVLVLVHDAAAVHCNDADFELLTKILSAIKLTINEIALVNLAHFSGDYFALAGGDPPVVAIFLGIEPADRGVPMRFPQFQVQPWGKTTFLYAPSLAEMNGNSAQQLEWKKSLWSALKRIFGN
jgi:hypothetical protein